MPLPRVGQRLPDFTLTDLSGKPRKLSRISPGRPLALFFFCGCAACGAVAREWAALQRTWSQDRTELRAKTFTVAVFLGTPQEAQILFKTSGMLPAQTHILSDPDGKISLGLYQSDPCPRLLVLDGKAILRYVNVAPDEQPQKAPATLLVARAADALKKLR